METANDVSEYLAWDGHLAENASPMRKLTISIYDSQFDMIPRSSEVSWDDLVSLMSKHHEYNADKKNFTHFNGSEYTTPHRSNEHIKAIHFVVLDYDGSLTVEQAKEHFRDFEHVGFTSYNHMYPKDGKPPVPKFRVVIPLTEPVPMERWLKIRDNLDQLAPGYDKASKKPHQPMAAPCVRPGGPCETWTNKGQWLDTSTWKESTSQPDPSKGTSFRRDDRYLLFSDTIETKKGFVTVGDVAARISGVRCPFHIDNTPSEFLNRSKSGHIFLHCKECGTIYARQKPPEETDEDDYAEIKQVIAENKTKSRQSQPLLTDDEITDIKQHIEPRHNSNQTEEIITSLGSLVSEGELNDALRNLHFTEEYIKNLNSNRKQRNKESDKAHLAQMYSHLFVKGDPEVPFDRDKRKRLTIKYCLKSSWNQMLMYAFEGYGKSHYGRLEAERGNRVLFASLSNRQAEEQYNSFVDSAPHLKCQLIVGREYNLLKKYEIEAVKGALRHPWDYGPIDEVQTKKRIKDALKIDNEQLESIWNETGAPKPDFENHDIVFTTFARVWSWGKMQSQRQRVQVYDLRLGRVTGSKVPDESLIVPRNTIVFFDDPSASMFNPLASYNERYNNIAYPSPTECSPEFIEKWNQENSAGSRDGEDLKKSPFENRIEIIERNGRRYFRRPNELKMGYGLCDTKLVFTTTEVITASFIEQLYPDIYVPPLMPDGPMQAGDIYMVKTEIVRSKLDGLTMPIMNRLKKSFHFEYIADGVGSEYNQTNTKGMNIFVENDTVVKCSLPSPYEVLPIVDGLGLKDTAQNKLDISKVIALDKLQQAIGRNCGYRVSVCSRHLDVGALSCRLDRVGRVAGDVPGQEFFDSIDRMFGDASEDLA